MTEDATSNTSLNMTSQADTHIPGYSDADLTDDLVWFSNCEGPSWIEINVHLMVPFTESLNSC
ncbi:5443_t:CDS:2 [Rhizophagus irregularis]|nr:5443_t:CDS:2 [Rhizophagus irregularis]